MDLLQHIKAKEMLEASAITCVLFVEKSSSKNYLCFDLAVTCQHSLQTSDSKSLECNAVVNSVCLHQPKSDGVILKLVLNKSLSIELTSYMQITK